jgi:Histidine kinase-, DNA gyrase B-, and HSP90-like ATPase
MVDFTVCVADTGPGIPLDELKRVFGQFFQIDNSNTKAKVKVKVKGGTGLSLAIAKQNVAIGRGAHLEMRDGRLWIESLGKAQFFKGRLRFAPHDGEAHPRRRSGRYCAALRDLLIPSGWEVAKTTDGRHGVAKAKSERPDLVPWTSRPTPALQLEQPRADRHTTPTQGMAAFADYDSSYSDERGNGSQSSTHSSSTDDEPITFRE